MCVCVSLYFVSVFVSVFVCAFLLYSIMSVFIHLELQYVH